MAKGFTKAELRRKLEDPEFREHFMKVLMDAEKEALQENKRLRSENAKLKRESSRLRLAARAYLQAVEDRDYAHDAGKRIALRLLTDRGEEKSKRHRTTETDRFRDAIGQKEEAAERVKERGEALKALIGSGA